MRFKLFFQKLDQVLVPMQLGQLQSRLPLFVLAVQTDLLRQEKEENVDMATHSRYV